MHRLGFFIILLLSVFGSMQPASCAADLPEMWLGKTVSELTVMAHGFLSRNETDSAIYAFAVAGNKYRTELDDNDKRKTVWALANAGALLSASSNDYTTSYRYLRRGLDLARHEGYDEIAIEAEMHMAGLYSLMDGFGNEASDLLRKCYHEAVKSGNNDIMTLSFLNLYVTGYDGDVEEFKEINVSKTKDNGMAAFARLLYHGMANKQAGRYSEARREFADMIRTSREQKDPLRCECLSAKLMAGCFMQEERYDSALTYISRIIATADSGDMQTEVINAYRLMHECYSNMGNTAMAQRMHIAYLEKKDSVANAINLNTLNNMRYKSDIESMENRLHDMAVAKQHREYVIAAISVMSLVIVMLVLVLYSKNKKLRSRNRFLYDKAIEAMKEEKHENSSDKPAATEDKGSRLRKYKDSSLTEQQKNDIQDKVMEVMADTEMICQTDFTLDKLARLADSNTRYVSQVINECNGMSFSVLLSNYRIREAMRRMGDTEAYGNLTIEAISQSVGFRTRSSFIKAFKGITGLTPSEYLREARDKK